MAIKKQVGLILSDKEALKKYNSGTAASICIPQDETLGVPSRVLAFNHQIGGHLPYGCILELYGEESTGKTLLAMDFGVVAQSLGGVVLWGDAEASFNGPWAIKNGLDLNRVILLPTENAIEIHSDWQADMIKTWRSKLTNNEPILLVVDSIGALEPMDSIESAQMDEKDMGTNRSKAIDKMLRRRNKLYAKYGVSVIYINQLRSKIGATKWEDPDTTPGGKAMRFYASIRIGLYQGTWLKDEKKNRIGRITYVRTKKNKVSPPRDNIKAQVFFVEHNGVLGYHKYVGLVTADGDGVLENMGILKRKKGIYYYKGEVVARGYENMLEKISTDDNFRRKLLKRAGIMTVSKMRERLENVTINRYPVKTKKSKDNGEEEQ